MIYKPPHKANSSSNFKIFLAGTIDMGNSEDWQKKVEEEISEELVDIYNPRRDDWDSSWKQTIDNQNFVGQVNWELDHLDKCDIILMNFLATSKSPITLLELGLYIDTGKLIVVCPKEFYRSGNVEIVCDRYDIPIYTTLQEGLERVKLELKKLR